MVIHDVKNFYVFLVFRDIFQPYTAPSRENGAFSKEIAMDLKITKATPDQLRKKPSAEEMGFGLFYSDHMFQMEYSVDQGWTDLRIEPYHNFVLDPAAMVFHYGQEAFEGFKAYPTADDRVLFFRPEKNMTRMNSTLSRICIPEIDEELVLEGIRELVRIDRDWIPTGKGESLYIRPTVIATEPHLGVRPSKKYIFYVITSPVGAYYSSGFAPVSIQVTEEYVRSAVGGLGFVKAGANYAASLLAAQKANEAGYSQVLWLDAAEKKYIEEVGTMNIFFVIDNEIITPELSGSLLPGITRSSVIELAKTWGITTTERKITIDELVDTAQSGALTEIFGSGTAAIIAPVNKFGYRDKDYTLADPQPGPITMRLFETLLGIQYGDIEDTFGWNQQVI
jgi:branched-chain amino acid aminotransferase